MVQKYRWELLHHLMILSSYRPLFLALSQTSPCFYISAVQSLLKTLSENEKLLVTSNFSFSHSVFYPVRELSTIFIEYEIVLCMLFQFGRV